MTQFRKTLWWITIFQWTGFTILRTLAGSTPQARLRPVDNVSGWSELKLDDTPTVEAPPLNITPLVVSGPAENRVDLMFFSDGYLAEEYDKFIQDATRLAQDVSGNQTFNTVKPLLNFWAAFTPSNESGVGVGGKPKDTVYGLYRDGTELRGVYYDKPEVARAACDSRGTQCDYPILLGNDPYYGGLGGEFTVITSSLANGPIILRHELGHSIIDVGEEYDGAETYFGVNHADNTSDLPWTHWLTNPPPEGETPRVERSVMPLQDYAWTLLNTSSPWTANFSSAGTYSKRFIQFSLSGLPEASDIEIQIDGAKLEWTPRQDIGLDRWFYNYIEDGGFAVGEHNVTFILKNPEREGAAQLCSVEIEEFGNDSEFIDTPGYYSVYPTFTWENATAYRPTNNDCLMRQVTTPDFCSVCTEGLWLSLLKNVSLIDSLKQNTSGTNQSRVLELSLVPLAEFRDDPQDVVESYSIVWSRNGTVLEAFTNKTEATLEDGDAALGTYVVDVVYSTEEVRIDKDGRLKASRNITVA